MKTTAWMVVLALWGAQALAQQGPAASQAVVAQVRQVDALLAARARLVEERAALVARQEGLSLRTRDAQRAGVDGHSRRMQDLLVEAQGVGSQLEAKDRMLAALDARMTEAARSLESNAATMTAGERAQVALDVRRVTLAVASRQDAGAPVAVVSTNVAMDSEALLERADLAADVEAKLMREADRAQARLKELEDQQSLAGEAQLLAQDRRLFDEDDRSVRATRGVTRQAAQPQAGTVASNTGGGTAPATGGTRDNGATGSPSNPGFMGGAGNVAETDSTGGAVQAPSAGQSTGVGVSRTQTVVDERTFALLREARSPLAAATPADEMRTLARRRAELLEKAQRLKAMQDALRRQAAQAKGAKE